MKTDEMQFVVADSNDPHLLVFMSLCGLLPHGVELT